MCDQPDRIRPCPKQEQNSRNQYDQLTEQKAFYDPQRDTAAQIHKHHDCRFHKQCCQKKPINLFRIHVTLSCSS